MNGGTAEGEYMGGRIHNYKDCDDIDLVARAIYGEICNVPPYSDNAYAVAKVIRNRIGVSIGKGIGRNAREVVTMPGQFNSVTGKPVNLRFFCPSLDFGAQAMKDVWNLCVSYAMQLNKGEALSPIGRTDIGKRLFFYDIQLGFRTGRQTVCENMRGFEGLRVGVERVVCLRFCREG